MRVTEKLTKSLTETKYLNADNVGRYRCIMRIFFENYEKLRYWLYQEDVYEQMREDPFFADYKMEQCQQDLNMLTEWKNLNTTQDTRKVSSIEEFKNRKFRYQMTEYSVEIEDWSFDWKTWIWKAVLWSLLFWSGCADILRSFPLWQRKSQRGFIPGGRT